MSMMSTKDWIGLGRDEKCLPGIEFLLVDWRKMVVS